MKVKLSITVDVDTQLWADEYGLDKDEVRDDVKRYFINEVRQAPPVYIGIAKVVAA